MGVWIWPTWWHQWHCLVLALAGTMTMALALQVVIMTSQLGIDQSAQRSYAGHRSKSVLLSLGEYCVVTKTGSDASHLHSVVSVGNNQSLPLRVCDFLIDPCINEVIYSNSTDK